MRDSTDGRYENAMQSEVHVVTQVRVPRRQQFSGAATWWRRWHVARCQRFTIVAVVMEKYRAMLS